MDVNDLKDRVGKLAACALLAWAWPAKGGRHDLALALSGFLLRRGWSEDDVVQFVRAAARVAGDDEIEDRVRAVQTTSANLAAGKRTTGGKKLVALLSERTVTSIADWLKLPRTGPQTVKGRPF